MRWFFLFQQFYFEKHAEVSKCLHYLYEVEMV